MPPPRDSPPTRAPFVLALLASLPALAALGAAAPGGETWRYLDFPFNVTAIAALLGAWALRRTHLLATSVVLLGTPVLRAAWAGVHDYLTFRDVQAQHLVPETQVYRLDVGILASDGFQCLAPWALGATFALLAALSITSRQAPPDRGPRLAGAWLLGLSVVVAALALLEPSWITLETLSGDGTVRATGGLPDTKVLTLVLACGAVGVGWNLLKGRPSGSSAATSNPPSRTR